MAENARIVYVVDRVEGADWAGGADKGEGTDGTDGTDRTEMVLFYLDCLVDEEFTKV